MQSHIKSGIEYALITLGVAGLCLWQLISRTQDGEPSASLLVLASLGLIVAVAMHCVFMMQLVRRTGRPFWRWLFAIVLLMPVGSAVLLALLLSDADAADS
jgi:multisubunit Na+/H+ antiporter MnhE subunit